MRSLLALVPLLPLVALPVGCTDVDVEDEDPIDGSFADGKADGYEILEGTSEALGILNLVNEASASSLRESVGLSTRAANAIVKARKGRDGQLLTEDDRIIWSLEELDALPYVGVRALQKLDQFSQEQGYMSNNYRALLYTYGTACERSRLYLNDEGDGYVEDEFQGDISRFKIENVPNALVAQLRAQIAEALPAEHARETIPGGTSEPEGTLTVYLYDGTTSVIDSYARRTSGVAHTRNVAPAAEEIRASVASLVQVRMPSMPE
jgi:hypothetical protein